MSKVIRIDRVRGTERFAITFWLKPHLRDFVRSLCGGDAFQINAYNVIGCFALSTLTTKPEHAHRVDDGFMADREKVTGTISVDHARREGSQSHSLPMFEFQVEHLFKHMMLVHVDVRRESGMSQIDAIREFLDLHEVDLHGIAIETLKKTMERRRKRAQVNSTAAGKFRATVSLVSNVRRAS